MKTDDVPELNANKLLMPKLAQQLLAFATEVYDSRGDENIINWSVAIDPATYLLLDRPIDYDEPVIIINFEFNVQKASAIADNQLGVKQLHDIAVINAMIRQLYVEEGEG